MRLLYTLLFVIIFISTSIGQTFTLPELIKMSKMDVDDFDTYVTSKGYVFHDEVDNDEMQSVGYALDVNENDYSKANKFITLYQRYSVYNFKYRYYVNYQTLDKKEYVKIKNQIKALGYILKDSLVLTDHDGTVSQHFEYKKGKSNISIFANYKSYEIAYSVNF